MVLIRPWFKNINLRFEYRYITLYHRLETEKIEIHNLVYTIQFTTDFLRGEGAVNEFLSTCDGESGGDRGSAVV